jgi:chromosome segregation ATPase
MDQLAQELAISENVRSDLEDKMEALEQQKQIFQQTVAESKGEVNMLENQLREIQAEHKQLQASYRELEKK